MGRAESWGLGEVAAVGMGLEAFDDGGELDVAAADVLVEVIDVEGVVGVDAVDDAHGVPLHAVLLQEADATHDALEGGLAPTGEAVVVVELLGAVDGDADEPVVAPEEGAPLVGEEGAVGLEAVVDEVALGVLTLEGDDALVEAERAHEGFAAVPGEEHLGLGLRFDVLANVGLERGVAHDVLTGLLRGV